MTSYEETVANLKEAYATLCGGSEHDVGLSAYSAFRCQCAVKDALELLKAQEPAKPTWRQGFAFCGKCGRQFWSGFKYCPDCGKEVKWDAGTST